MSLSWSYFPESEELIPIEAYESIREPFRRSKSEMKMPRSLREEILRDECGVSTIEIARAVRQIMRTKMQRRQTINNLHLESFQEGLEKFKKPFLRISCKSKSSQVEIEYGDLGKYTKHHMTNVRDDLIVQRHSERVNTQTSKDDLDISNHRYSFVISLEDS